MAFWILDGYKVVLILDHSDIRRFGYKTALALSLFRYKTVLATRRLRRFG